MLSLRTFRGATSSEALYKAVSSASSANPVGCSYTFILCLRSILLYPAPSSPLNTDLTTADISISRNNRCTSRGYGYPADKQQRLSRATFSIPILLQEPIRFRKQCSCLDEPLDTTGLHVLRRRSFPKRLQYGPGASGARRRAAVIYATKDIEVKARSPQSHLENWQPPVLPARKRLLKNIVYEDY
jgi:hypothetical protein